MKGAQARARGDEGLQILEVTKMARADARPSLSLAPRLNLVPTVHCFPLKQLSDASFVMFAIRIKRSTVTVPR
jgi:hypothetical protein